MGGETGGAAAGSTAFVEADFAEAFFVVGTERAGVAVAAAAGAGVVVEAKPGIGDK